MDRNISLLKVSLTLKPSIHEKKIVNKGNIEMLRFSIQNPKFVIEFIKALCTLSFHDAIHIY